MAAPVSPMLRKKVARSGSRYRDAFTAVRTKYVCTGASVASYDSLAACMTRTFQLSHAHTALHFAGKGYCALRRKTCVAATCTEVKCCRVQKSLAALLLAVEQVTCLRVAAESLAMFCSRPDTKRTAVSSLCRFRDPLFFFVTVLLCRLNSTSA